MKNTCLVIACSLTVLLVSSAFSRAEDLKVISLPPAHKTGGAPLMDALQQRRTIREIKPDPLPQQLLGDMLWAAYGINRSDSGHRVAPSAMNSQEIDIYVALQGGLYIYEPKPHQLRPVASRDVRARTSGQEFGTNAPVTLIYVADLSRLGKAKSETRFIYANFDAGCICQNVYLFCASAGLATVVHDLDRQTLKPAMDLKPNQEIVMAQAVGYARSNKP